MNLLWYLGGLLPGSFFSYKVYPTVNKNISVQLNMTSEENNKIYKFLLFSLNYLTWFFLIYKFQFTIKMIIIGILTQTLWTIALIDQFTSRIPLNLLVLCLILAVFYSILGYDHKIWFSFLSSIIFGLIIVLLSLITKKTMMGSGDLLLINILALFLSWEGFFIFLTISSCLGLFSQLLLSLIFKRQTVSFPFAPYLVLGFIIVYCYGYSLINLYFYFLKGIL